MNIQQTELMTTSILGMLSAFKTKRRRWIRELVTRSVRAAGLPQHAPKAVEIALEAYDSGDTAHRAIQAGKLHGRFR